MFAALNALLTNAVSTAFTGLYPSTQYSQSSVDSEFNAASYQYMNDGNADGASNNYETSTRSVSVSYQWIRADIGSVQYVNKIVIGYPYPNYLAGSLDPSYTRYHLVQGSSDGTTWTDITTIPDFNATNFPDGLVSLLVNGNYRYIQVAEYGNTGIARLTIALTEFQVWVGQGENNIVPVTATISASAGLDMTAAAASTVTATRAAAAALSGVMAASSTVTATNSASTAMSAIIGNSTTVASAPVVSADVVGAPVAIIGTPTSSASTSVTIPSHSIGDLIVIFAYRDGNQTIPGKPAASGTVPAWVDIDAANGANSNSSRTAYFTATATNHTSGTWTNATGMVAVVLRNQAASPIGGNATGGSTSSNTAVAPAITLSDSRGYSQILHFFGHRTVTAWSTAPSGYTLQTSVATEVALLTKDTTTSDGAVTQSLTASASSGYRGTTVEIVPLIK